MSFIILIETADKNPGEDWNDKDHVNAAGYRHSYNYGFGRVNAKKAVEAALTWTNIAPERKNPLIGTKKEKINIPPHQEICREIDIDENIRIEFVELTLDMKHDYWCNLEVTLTSPHGTTSILSTKSLHCL